MAAKMTHTFKASGKKEAKALALEVIEALQALPQHKWIPAEEMAASSRATVTPRQANWLTSQLAKAVDGLVIEFTPVIEEAVPEA